MQDSAILQAAYLGEHMKMNVVASQLVRFFGSIAFLGSIAVGTACWIGSSSPMVSADEPASKFLERLKEEGLFDQALRYLDISV